MVGQLLDVRINLHHDLARFAICRRGHDLPAQGANELWEFLVRLQQIDIGRGPDLFPRVLQGVAHSLGQIWRKERFDRRSVGGHAIEGHVPLAHRSSRQSWRNIVFRDLLKVSRISFLDPVELAFPDDELNCLKSHTRLGLTRLDRLSPGDDGLARDSLASGEAKQNDQEEHATSRN
jgi:hypothetical protein